MTIDKRTMDEDDIKLIFNTALISMMVQKTDEEQLPVGLEMSKEDFIEWRDFILDNNISVLISFSEDKLILSVVKWDESKDVI